MAGMDALSAAQKPLTSASNAFGALDSSQFVKIIFTELTNQDPLAPSDSKALLEQISTIRSIQSSIDLTDKLQQLVGQQEWTSAAGLIGKRVSGLSENLMRVEGTVKSVSRTDYGAVLNLESGARVPVQLMDEVLGAPAATTGAAA
ncbi:MAG: hypothetical protein KF678_09345 [Phycisphaeraceae bacterium]|nr:hypothetical protein [Phycisphaeraceae bacterium]